MPWARPTLVFVSGPQAGQRASLMSAAVTLGRSPNADVRLVDEHASREQLRLEFTRDGWLMTNLSGHGTRVNGKRFKSARKKVLLATGDVLGVGVDTSILFVSAEDDAQAAIDAYLTEHPLPEEAPPAPLEPQPIEPEPVAEPAEAPQPAPAGEAPEDAAATARRAKLRKYAIYLGVYLAGLAGVVVLLSSMRGEQQVQLTRSGALDARQIAEIFSTVDHQRNAIPTRAAAELRKAQSLYDNLPGRGGDLYRCVRSFQEYLAYKRVGAFDEADDELKYRDALGRLIDEVQHKYRNAWAYEQSEDWRQARRVYEELLIMVPEEQRDSPVYRRFVQNVISHLTYVREQLRSGRRRR